MKKIVSRIGRFFGIRRSIGSILLFAFMALRIWDPAPLENLRLRGFDFYQSMRPRVATARPVVIVDIDEASLSALGQWPWPRTLIADLVTKLQQAGTLAIGFDIVFPEPDRMSPSVAVENFRNIDEATRAKLKELPGNDQVLADAMQPAHVVLAQSGLVNPTTVSPDLPPTSVGVKGPEVDFFSFDGLLTNVSALEKAAAGRGLITIVPDRDGIIRRVPLVMEAAERLVPALTLEMLRVATQAEQILVTTDAFGIRNAAIPKLVLPTDRQGRVWINFAKHDQARFVSAKDVIAGNIPADRFAGRLALIGTSATGLLDTKTTPIDAAVPGVEIHAQLLENAFTGSLLTYPNYARVLELAIAFVTCVAILVLAPMIGALSLLALGFFAAAILVTASWILYSRYGVMFDVTFPLLSSFAIYAALVFTSYFREQQDRRRIRSAFGQYLSPALVEQLALSPQKLVLGGEERNMTIMFSDVRGFTTISESFKHDPQGLTQLMNRFLTPLTNAIIDCKGTIDKYMGDAIMAFWNAPLEDSEHEANACRAALDMLRRVDTLNAAREQEAAQGGQNFIPIHIGVGINTGHCVVGNMGSDLRFDYSVLGDSVNLASRLEGRSKSYGTPIIVGAATASKISNQFAALEIDLITVKGKTQPERIYAILGGEDVLTDPAFQRQQELNTAMLGCYRARDWQGALDAAKKCQAGAHPFGLSEVYALYIGRIEAFRETPPPADWDGVFAVDTK